MRNPEPTTPDPRAWCIWLIRPYIERGDSLESIMDGNGGYGGPPRGERQFGVDIHVGRDILYGKPRDVPIEDVVGNPWPHRLRVRRGEIGAVLDGPGYVHTGVFRLEELAADIRVGVTQVTLFGGIA